MEQEQSAPAYPITPKHMNVNLDIKVHLTVKEAVDVIRTALKEDESPGSYYYTWQANLAMAFIDEYTRLNPHMHDGNREILHNIANNAAKNFLNLLIK